LIRLYKVDKKEIYIATVRGVLFAQMYSELLDMIKTQPNLDKKSPLVTELV
jgi:hypothetical protein